MRAKLYPVIALAAFTMLFAACKKDATNLKSIDNNSTITSGAASASTVLATGSIGIGTTSSLNTNTPFAGGRDSIYAMHCFPPKGHKDSVAFSSLSSTITAYLTANYAGYTAVKAFAISDSTKTVINYITIIKYNSNLVALKFTAAGAFVAVLEQAGGADLGAPNGCHQGGPFANRGGFQVDTVALSALPTVVKSAFTTAYPTDTLIHAALAPDGNYVLISKNKVLYATSVSATGTVINHTAIPGPPAKHTAVTQANLPSAISTYLTTTYPGYVFDKAFSASNSSGIIGYEAFITSNSTKYAVTFDASGSFVKAVVVR